MEITKDEALGIIQKTDPRHEAYYVKQEPALVDAVREAFEREPEESSDPYLDKVLSKSMEKPRSEPGFDRPTAKAESPADMPADQNDPWGFTPEKSLETLKAEWGDLFDFNASRVASKENQEKIFTSWATTDEDHAFWQDLTAHVGNHPSAIKMYLHILDLIDGYKK